MEKAIDAANWHDQIQSSPLDEIRWAASELADYPHVMLKIGRGALALLVNHRETKMLFSQLLPGAILFSRERDARLPILELICMLAGVDDWEIAPGNGAVIVGEDFS